MYNQHKDKLIIGLLVVVIALLGYIAMSSQSGNPQGQYAGSNIQNATDGKDKKGPNQSTHPYEKNEVKNTIVKNAFPPIQACFKTFMAQNPEFVSGRITVDWQIDLNGEVIKPEIITSEIPDINKCVLETVGKLQFPSPPSDRPWYIVHKFNFRRDDVKPPEPIEIKVKNLQTDSAPKK